MTETVLNTTIAFFAGFNFGLVIAAVIIFFRIKGSMLAFYDREKATIDKLATPASPQAAPSAPQDETVTTRLNRASELTRIQNELISQAQQPSQNALHSRHKNGLIQQYKALEVEKMGVLQSIIKDGHDPMVTVFNQALKQNQEVKLSDFLTQFVPNTPKETPTDPNLITEGEGIRKVEKAGKTFYVIDGGKKTTQ